MDKWPTRPTTDMAREALFNILDNRIDFAETKGLDLFGGTGSIALELYSRGSQDVTYVESYRDAASFVKKTVEELDAQNEIHIVTGDAYKFLERTNESFDFIFADPPYNDIKTTEIPGIIFSRKIIRDSGLVVIEHDRHQDFRSSPNFLEVRKYGKVQFSFFQSEGS